MSRATLAAAVLAALVAARPAAAFQVGSGMTWACHEWATVDALYAHLCPAAGCTETLPSWPLRLPDAPPEGPAMELADADFPIYADVVFDWRVRLALFSLVTGSRFNDLQGFGMSEHDDLRLVHMAAGDQEDHCLRAAEDDGPEGDRAALARCRAFIEDELALAEKAFRSSDPWETIPIHVEFYGTLDVPLWSGFFHLGQALHALQDAYSHTLRSEDLSEVVAVANYVECIEPEGHDPARDGPCHSGTLDQCLRVDVEPLFVEATARSEALLGAFFDGPRSVEAVLDAALHLREGCGPQDGWCATPWAEVATRESDVLERSWYGRVLGCSAGSGGPAGDAAACDAAVLALLGALLLGRRRSARG